MKEKRRKISPDANDHCSMTFIGLVELNEYIAYFLAHLS